jgi:dipeptidyl aminopeptidase/acylaminoacyl peptidase
MRSFRIGFLLLFCAAGVSAQQTAKRAFTPSDWYRVTNVSSPAMSPDGRLVAMTVTTVKESENKRHSEVWVVPTAGGEPVRWTSPGTESSNPRWSHDGSMLFFTSSRPGGKGSTWALRMDRQSGEAFQMENYPSGSVPASGAFAVWTASGDEEDEADDAAADDPFAKMQPMARPPFGTITRPVDPKRFDGRHVVDLGYKANGRGFVPNRREARTYRASQIWKQPFAGGEKTQLTNATYSHRSAVVSPDGKWIAFVADPELRTDSVVQAERDSIAPLPYDAARDEAPRNDADIFIVPASGGEPRRLTRMNGSEGRLVWSPDGKQIAFVSALERTKSDRVWLVDVGGGEPRNLLGDWQYEPSSVDWTPKGDLMMSAAIGGRTALFRLSPKDGKMTEVIGGRRRINDFAFDEKMTKVAFVATDVDEPTELYIADIDGKNERKLTGFNDALLADVAFSDAERFTYPSVGGLEIEAWMMQPYGYEAGRKYPVVLYIHGGPHSAYGEGWFDEFQNIAGAGMWVLFTNPRGSSGYGADFTYSTRGRWGLEDYEDLMKAVDIGSAIRQPGLAGEADVRGRDAGPAHRPAGGS